MSEEKRTAWWDPALIDRQYRDGIAFKNGLGDRGAYEQGRMNERFYVGDQWHGAQCGKDRPLLMHNVIKRIGDYKMSTIGAAPLAVTFSADGVPCAAVERERLQDERARIAAGGRFDEGELSDSERINLVMGALTDYFRVTAERTGFEQIKASVLRNAYVTGTGVLYVYWDDRIMTGLYADERHTAPIRGDIRFEVLDIENVYPGDPTLDSVQEQPYILIAQRCRVDDIRRRMRQNGRPQEQIDAIRPDREIGEMSGDLAEKEPEDSRKALVLTKLYKQYAADGETFTVMAAEVCGDSVVREPYDTRLRLYPLAKMDWERRNNCFFGDSEVTYLIPNQIAINRANTASAWSVMAAGMPIMLVNGDLVPGGVTNDPGQIIRVYGSAAETASAVRFVEPPNSTQQYAALVDSLIVNTLTQSGANEAALGDIDPKNTSAIMAVREASIRPLNMAQNRFYAFIEDAARICAEFWVSLYGERLIHISDKNGDWYLPFDGKRYRDLAITTRVDVGAAGVWSESQSLQALDGLLQNGVIDADQYLERIPKGIVPDLCGLQRERHEAAVQSAAAQETAEPDPDALPDDYRARYAGLSDEDKAKVLTLSRG